MPREHTDHDDVANATQAPKPCPSDSHNLSRPELARRWALWSIEGMGSRRLSQLVSITGGELDRLWTDRGCVLRAIKKMSLSDRIQGSLLEVLAVDPETRLDQLLETLNVSERLVHRYDTLYPRRLLDLHDPPEFLFVRGSLHELGGARPLALVGSRKVPLAQEHQARVLSASLAQAGVLIVSGGALGMDACAHRGALDANMPTVAVLPGGLHELTPRTHLRLFQEIVDGKGLLISEYPLEVAPRRYHYARRNRLIAALSRAVLVLKAAPDGGTMLTVKAAQELGRPIMALPYEASDKGGRGSNRMIQRGEARLVCTCQEILASAFGLLEPIEVPPCKEGGGEEKASATTACEGLGAKRDVPGLSWPQGQARCDVDALARWWKVGVAEAQVRLFELELSGRVRKVPGAASYERAG